jgi:nitrogenase molybdenum-iron protein alpha/beta subunit
MFGAMLPKGAPALKLGTMNMCGLGTGLASEIVCHDLPAQIDVQAQSRPNFVIVQQRDQVPGIQKLPSIGFQGADDADVACFGGALRFVSSVASGWCRPIRRKRIEAEGCGGRSLWAPPPSWSS